MSKYKFDLSGVSVQDLLDFEEFMSESQDLIRRIENLKGLFGPEARAPTEETEVVHLLMRFARFADNFTDDCTLSDVPLFELDEFVADFIVAWRVLAP